MASSVTTGGSAYGGSHPYLAQEILARRVGEEAAQAVNIAPVVWQESVEGESSMAKLFRYLDNLGVASAATEAADLPQVSWSPEGVFIGAGLEGFYVQESKLMDIIAPDALEKIAQQGGSSLGRTVDQSLAALFASLTGGTVGSTGAALTLTNMLTADANLDASFAIGKRYAFVHPRQFLNLRTDIVSKNYGVSRINADAQGNETIEIGSITVMKNALVSKVNSNADWAGGVIVEQALGLVIGQAPRVEILPVPKQASWAVECTVAFGAGVVRPTFGCLVQSGVSA